MNATETDRARLVEIGAPAERVQVTGNLKFDVPLPAAPPIVASLRTALREAGEELGIQLSGPIETLGQIRQTGGKAVEAFAMETDVDITAIASNHKMSLPG